MSTKHVTVMHKMHTNGNDFLILETENSSLPQPLIKAIANRHLGIGCDQVLLPIKINNHTVKCLFYNNDGSPAALCLNGVYALACYLHTQKVQSWTITTTHTEFSTGTKGGHTVIKIPMSILKNTQEISLKDLPQDISSTVAKLTSVGNQHLLIKTDHISTYPLSAVAKSIQNQDLFPDSINVSAYTKNTSGHITMKTYERGAGLTLACGSAGLALFLTEHGMSETKSPYAITQPGGTVYFSISKKPAQIFMQANSAYIAKIEFNHKGKETIPPQTLAQASI